MKATNFEVGQEISLETEYGLFSFRYASLNSREALIVSNNPDKENKINVRIQSSCVFSETFHALSCDCSDQLIDSIKLIGKEKGVIIYLFDEGRGVGLKKKIEAIRIQNELGLNTAEAFEKLGFKSDERNFELAISILKNLYSGREIELITNNPLKVEKLRESGINISTIVYSVHSKNETIKNYLLEKKNVLGHIIELYD